MNGAFSSFVDGAEYVAQKIDENPWPLSTGAELERQLSQWPRKGPRVSVSYYPPANLDVQSQPVPSNGGPVQSLLPVPQTAFGAQMDDEEVQYGHKFGNLSSLPIDRQAFDRLFPKGSGFDGGVPAQGSEDDPLLFLGSKIEILRPPMKNNQLVEPDPSNYACFADFVGVHVLSHEDYGFTSANCRKFGDIPGHKYLPVFCLTCGEPLPQFDNRCQFCKERLRKQPAGTLEPRFCIICKFNTTSLNTIFCKYHIEQPARFNGKERRILKRAGICNHCWKQDRASSQVICEDCRDKRKHQQRQRRRKGKDNGNGRLKSCHQ